MTCRALHAILIFFRRSMEGMAMQAWIGIRGAIAGALA
jgi:hypothetical protein